MAVGFTAGYRGGWIDEILNMITNVFLVIPTLAVLLVITSYLQGARRDVRGDLHRRDVVAVGGPRHSRSDVLAAVSGTSSTGQAERPARLEDHRPRSRRT
jgi:ABC-type dipeptide/oligopeptide/nickel transport system permease subunit